MGRIQNNPNLTHVHPNLSQQDKQNLIMPHVTPQLATTPSPESITLPLVSHTATQQLPSNSNPSASYNSHTISPDTPPPPSMASLTAMTAVAHPATSVRGLSGSSLAGTRLAVKPARRSLSRSSAGAVVAKYGEKSVYFDLEDLPNTTGQWDLYGSDAPSPYNSLQSKFFETFAAPFTKRGLLLKFLILGGGSALAYLSSTATGDILPIKKGPQLPPKLGPRGKI